MLCVSTKGLGPSVRPRCLAGWVVLGVFLAGCGSEPDAPVVAAPLGQPIPGLAPEELARFEAGRVPFNLQFTPETGLGPRFNENSCNACHTNPEDGGTGETHVTKATRWREDGTCDPLAAEGGENVRIQVTALAAAAGAEPSRVPATATHRALFTIPFVFGTGLVGAVPQQVLDGLADPDDRDGDGISGRVGRDAEGRPARFGRKADVATLADFVEGATRLEMGITTPFHPDEARAGGAPPLPGGVDPTAEPEVDEAFLRSLVDYVALFAPPGPLQPRDEAHAEEISRGKALFEGLGCTACHVASLPVGPDAPEAARGQAIAPYSDFLLHDMGPDLEGTCGPGADTREWRTEPLWGIRYRTLFLHDGRAGRVMDAVLMHGGEAQGARDRFAALDRLTQELVLRFLDSL